MNTLTTLFKALSDQNRLRILAALIKYKELCACQIIELMQVTGATVSRHMGVLIASGLVDSRKESRWVYYRLRRETVELMAVVRWIEQQLANDPDITRDAKTLDKILTYEPEEISRRQRSGGWCESS